MKKNLFIRGEGLIPRGSAAVMKVLNPSPIHYENNIPRGSAPRLLIFIVLLFIINVNCFSQNLPSDRVVIYNSFSRFCNEYLRWYSNLWISREREYYNAKGENERNEFVQEMRLRSNLAWEQSRSDFRNKVYNDNNFKNEVKLLLEQLNNTEHGIMTEWNIILNRNGYSPEGYNNIEQYHYNLLFLINSCMFLDQEFSDNNITDSIIEKVREHFDEIRSLNTNR
jgi:hypothetical protein